MAIPTVSSGVTSTGLTVSSGATLLVSGTISSTTIANGGVVSVATGGADYGSLVQFGGTEWVLGTATGDLVYGALNTSSGKAATLTNETIEAGGVFTLANAGLASNTVVLSGGTFIVSGANTGAVNTVVSGGGIVNLDSPKAQINGSLTFSGGGNTLDVTSAASSSTYGELATISGFSSTDKIDILAIASAGATISVVTSGLNNVATVTNGVTSETFIFAGTTTYTSATLSLAADANGKAEILYSSATGPTGSTTSVTTSTVSGAYTETSGNTLLVLNGGIVSAATIDAGGFLTVNGGADYAAIVSSGGVETVSAGSAGGDQIAGAATVASGASVSSETVMNGGSLVVAIGGVEAGAVVQAGGSATILGSASGDQVYGALNTSSGVAGLLTSETVEAGGVLTLANGDTASNTTVLSGGTFTVSGADAAATGTVLSGGGVVNLASPKAQIDGVLTFSGGGNTLEVTSVASTGYGDLAVISGFSTTDKVDLVAIAAAGASINVVTNGVNDVATVTNGASSESFIFAGTSTYTGFTLQLTSGGAGEAEIVYNPNAKSLTVSSGVTSTGLSLTSGETLTVLAGGTASATAVQSGAFLVISGADSSATVSGGGTETIFGTASGDHVAGAVTVDGSATGEIVASGGSLLINGGSNASATISSGGTETVTNSGTTSGDQIFGGLTVNGGGDTGETVYAGGSVTISSGLESSTTVQAGGNELILGSATGDQIYGTQLVSAATAVVTSETVYAGGQVNVFLKGGVASATLVTSGGELNVSGYAYASNTVLSGGGILDLESPKAAVTGSLTFEGGGNTFEISNITSAGYGFSSGGYGLSTVISGFSSTDKIDITSGAYTGSALTLTQSVSGGNTVVNVISGLTTVETFTFAGTALDGYFALLSDNAGGEDVEVPPVSVTTSVTTSTASGVYAETATNTLLVLNGGSVSAAAIDSGAFLTVDGGADSAAIIFAGATETVIAGAASGDQIQGVATVSGGSVTDETVLSGGQLDVLTGATASNVVLSGGGTVELAASTASLTGSLTFTGGSNTLQATVAPSDGAGDQAVITGFSSADKIDVVGAGGGATLTFSTDGSGDSVATVSGAAGSESFVFGSPSTYNAGSMSLISDGAGGVDLILDTTPVVTMTSLGGSTNKATTLVNGTVDTVVDPEAIGTTVSVTENGTVVGSGTVGANGQWSASVTFLNDDGDNVLSASDTDVAGNKGVTSQSLTYSVNTAAAAFVAGNLVISISGDGDGSGQYGDNAASAITLEQITTGGALVSQLVLPQVTTVVNGVTEYAISGEYGSSSEGTLELSGDGHSLVIGGYGVNAQAFNSGGAAIYGTSALAQSTSLTGGPYTTVDRVIADINADGVVDTSTSIGNIFNTNNPRSVTTVDGTSFWISGQGVKGDTTQGVFYVLDGASTATAINTATDTRSAFIFNGQLYVSVDSTQGATGIEAYGGTPTSSTSPTLLQGLGPSVTLTSGTANGVNNADIGSNVYLSPENYFFANANTLYVADGGDPKNGGLGDGGLQKWVYNGTTWSLQYTLSAGLNLVADNATSGTSGLIGLTGKVVGDSVELYATNETLTDLGQTYVYAITDQLSSTTGSGESFTEIMAAAPGENIRGISFAPTAYAPTITGTLAGQTSANDATVVPFSGVSITDGNTQASETLTITVSGPGSLAGAGLSGGKGGVYTLAGTAAVVTAELDALVFTPAGAPATTTTTTFTLSDVSSAYSDPTVDTTTTVTDTDAPLAPTITTLVGAPTKGSAVELKGTGMVGETVTLYADGGASAVGTGTVGADGTFDITTSATFGVGTHTFTATETDAANATSQASGEFSVTINAPGAPVLSAPTTLLAQAGKTTALTVTLAETNVAVDETFTVTVADAKDILSATGAGVANSGTNSLTITGSLAEITADLATLGVRPTAPGADTVTVSATDSNGGVATPTTTALTTNGPVITVPSAKIIGEGLATPIGGIKLSLVGTVGKYETVTATLSDASGLLTASGAGVSGSGTTTLVITGSLVQVNADLATLQDTSTAPGKDTIKVSAKDSFGTSAAGASVNVTVNGSPTLSGPGSVNLTKGHAGLVGGISLSETGTTTGETFTLTVADNYGLLTAAGAGVTGKGTTSLTITGSLSRVNAALMTLKDTDSVSGSDTLTIQATDSLGGSATPVKVGVTASPASVPAFVGAMAGLGAGGAVFEAVAKTSATLHSVLMLSGPHPAQA